MLLPAIALPAIAAGVTAVAVPVLLRRLPPPAEEPELRFAGLADCRFRLAVFGTGFATGSALLLASEPALWPIWVPLAALGSLLGLIDLHTGYLPLRLSHLTLGLVSAGALASCWLRDDWQPALAALAAGAGATACYALLWRLSRGQLGFGDVRLAGVLGVATGAASLTVLVWSFILGSIIGAGWALAVRLLGHGREFPYGPSMLLGVPAAVMLSALLPA